LLNTKNLTIYVYS